MKDFLKGFAWYFWNLLQILISIVIGLVISPLWAVGSFITLLIRGFMGKDIATVSDPVYDFYEKFIKFIRPKEDGEKPFSLLASDIVGLADGQFPVLKIWNDFFICTATSFEHHGFVCLKAMKDEESGEWLAVGDLAYIVTDNGTFIKTFKPNIPEEKPEESENK